MTESRRLPSWALPAWAAALLLLAAVALVSAPALPRAAFVPDDYRYLSLLREMDAGVSDALARSTIVENRWDDNWWIEDGTFVRFFRPLVIASYALDRAIFGESDAGFVLVNILMHAIVTLLIWSCLRRLVPGEWAAWLGALVFATQSCHAEQLWYVAGRTDTLAAIFFFAAFAMFLAGRTKAAGRVWAVGVAALYLLALLVKEYAVLLPLFFVLADRWIPHGGGAPTLLGVIRQRKFLYRACAVAAALFFIARFVALGEAGSGVKPYPYFHLPDRAGFVEHVAATSTQYTVALVTGLPCAVFLTSTEQLHDNYTKLFERVWGYGFLSGAETAVLAIGVIAALALLVWGMRSPRGRFFGVFFLVLTLPMLPLYSTGRYLYLPGLGWCGLVALVGNALAKTRLPWLAIGWGVFAVVSQAAQCNWSLTLQGRQPGGQSRVDSTVSLLRDSRLDFNGDEPTYVIDLPKKWIVIQFLAPILHTRLPQAVPTRVLCKAPHDAALGLAEVKRVDAHTIELARPNGPLHQQDAGGDFDQRVVQVGDRIREADYEVTVLEVVDGMAKRIRVRFERPLAQIQLGKCVPGQGGKWQVVPVR